MKDIDPYRRVPSVARSDHSSLGLIRGMLILLLLVIGSVAGLIYVRYGTLTLAFLEKELPEIETPRDLLGFGADPVTVRVPLRDRGIGLDEVVVRIEQNGKKQDIYRQTFPPQPPVTATEIEFTLNGKEKGLREGSAKLEISLFDRSLWSNSARWEGDFPVTFGKPRVEVLTGQHNVAIAGTELVFYRVKGSNITETGVRVSDTVFFPGFQAMLLNDAFRETPDVYFAFFALPIDFDRGTQKPMVYAKNSVGNTGSATFPYLVLPRRFKDPEMKLSDDFLRAKFDDLLPPLYEAKREPLPSLDFDALSSDERIRYFRMINEEYRGLLQTTIASSLASPETRRHWDNPFVRPLAAAPTSAFGETRRYTYNGVSAGGSLHAGIDLADRANAVTMAANGGKVVFADFLGIYGNTVIIDHGFGLSSLYGHLSSMSVQVGDMVAKGQTIGRTGMTGLAGGDHLHFEIRIANTPVTPIEFWDQRWITDHIENKISSVIEQLTAQAELAG